MSKKDLKISGVIFTVLSFASLFLPWVYAGCEGALVSADMTTAGIGLTEYTVWGTVMFILPVLIAGVAFSKLNDKTKTILFLGLYLLGNVSFYYTASVGIECLREISTEYVRVKVWLLLYPIFMFFSLLSFYLSCNTNTAKSPWKH